LINQTSFLIQARENEFYPTNTYQFYYYQKGVNNAPRKDIQSNSRQVSFVFKENDFNSTLSPTITYQVYADVYIKDSKITLTEEITLFLSTISFYNSTSYNSTQGYNPNQEIIKAVPIISSTMSTSDTLTAATLISQLISDPTIAVQNKPNNSTVNSTQAIQAVNKPIVSKDGKISLPPKIECNDEYCNNKGFCIQLSRDKRDCKCLPKFSGSNCQISQENKKVFDELSQNLTSSMLNKLNMTKIDDSIPASQAINQQNFQAINTLSTSISKMNPTTDIIQNLASSVKLSMPKIDNPEFAKEIVKSVTLIESICTTLFDTLAQLTQKLKYQKLEQDYKSGKIDSTKINVIPVDFTKDNVTGFYNQTKQNNAFNASANSTSSSNNPSQNLIPTSNMIPTTTLTNNPTISSNIIPTTAISGITPTRQTTGPINSSTSTSGNSGTNTSTKTTTSTATSTTGNSPKNKRILQNSQNTSNSTDANNFILQVNDNSVLSLPQDQINSLKSAYQSIMSNIQGLNLAMINANKPNALDYYGTGSYFEYYISSIQDIKSYSFKNYFAKRIADNLSYFDALDCLKSFISSNSASNPYNFSTIYFVYYYFIYPIFNLDSDLSNKALSLSDSIKFFDANAKEIQINNCPIPIYHYLPIIPSSQNSQDFVNKLNLFPQKYYDVPQYNLNKSYMPYYIFQNGTVDNSNPTDYQKDIYYRQYALNFTSYDTINGFYNNPNNQFKYLTQNGYSVSTSKSTGEFTLFAYSDPVTTQLPYTYFMNYNQIFTIGENYRPNPSWYTVIFQLGFYIIALILTISLKNIFRKYNNNNDWNEYENSQMDKDNHIFGDNRYEFFGHRYSNYSTNIKSDDKLESEVEQKMNNNSLSNNAMANNKLSKKKKDEDLKDNEENKGEEGKIVVKDFELDKKANVEGQDEGQDENSNKLKIESDKKNDEDFESKKNSNKTGYARINNNNSKHNREYKTNKKIYNIFYFIGLRNIYANLILLSSPFSPKYKTLSKFAFFVWLEMLITVLLFVFWPFKFNVKMNKIF